MLILRSVRRALSHVRFASNQPLILGIETSCDDTGAAVMRGNEVLGEAIHTQRESQIFGGILPPIAQSFHRKHIERIVEESLQKANVKPEDLDAIAVTNRPGMMMSLAIGFRYAKHLSRKYQKPLIPVHHMEAHALTVRMEHDVKFPFLCLLISGGHSLLAVVQDVDEFLLLGETLDDAPGEAFDKIARRLKLSNLEHFKDMNGGQAIEEAARQCANPTDKYRFPLMLYRYRNCQFSFAGMKNTAKRHIQYQEKICNLDVDQVIPDYPDFCANLLGAITRHICHRTQRAIEFCERRKLMKDPKEMKLVVSGGVACNDFIFNSLSEMCDLLGYTAVRPSKKLCTDNGIMIAWNGVEKFNRGKSIYPPDVIDDLDYTHKCQLGKSYLKEVSEESIACKWVKIPSIRFYARSADLVN